LGKHGRKTQLWHILEHSIEVDIKCGTVTWTGLTWLRIWAYDELV
jgi:hypothetical protein